MPRNVTTLLTWTVALRPILFIRSAVGALSSRNQTKMAIGISPASVSLSWKSSFTWLVTMPATSPNPITTKAKRTGRIAVFLFIIMGLTYFFSSFSCQTTRWTR